MFSKSAIWVVVALLLFMLFKQFDNHSTTGGSKTIAYSELLDDIKARRLKDVVIEGQNITALRADDTKVRATATGLDKGLVSDLVNNGSHFDIKPPEEAGFLQQIFISWFPMLLLIVVWIIYMRRSQGGVGGGRAAGQVARRGVRPRHAVRPLHRADGQQAAHWEHTVAVTEDGPWVLTALDGGAAQLGGTWRAQAVRAG